MREWLVVGLLVAVLSGCGSEDGGDADECDPSGTYNVTFTKTAGSCGDFDRPLGLVLYKDPTTAQYVLEDVGGMRFNGSITRNDVPGLCRTFVVASSMFQLTQGPATLSVDMSLLSGTVGGRGALDGAGVCTASYDLSGRRVR